jgi:hypothetical protein
VITTITYMIMQDRKNFRTIRIFMPTLLFMNEPFKYFCKYVIFFMLVSTRLKQWLRIISAACRTYVNALCVFIM